jgi:hypothetical protein
MKRYSPRYTILFGLLIGFVVFVFSLIRALGQPIDFDATGYVWLSKVLSGADPSQFDAQHLQLLFNIRQMGYPVFISPFTNLTSSDDALRISVSLTQLAIYWFAVFSTHKAVALVIDKRRATIVSFALLSLPFPYFLITEVLADSLAASFSLIAFSAVLISVFCSARKTTVLWYLLSLFAMASAMAVRQDTHYAAIMVFICGGVVWGKWQKGTTRSVPNVLKHIVSFVFSGIFSIFIILLLRLPNWYLTNKYLGQGTFQPPNYISTDLFIQGGLEITRYVTGLGELGGGISWKNPAIDPDHLIDVSHAWQFYIRYPIEGISSILSKTFALTDWELPFTFYEALPKGRNWLLSFYNYLLVGNGLLGFYLAGKNLFCRALSRSQKFVLFAVVFSFLPYLGIHALSHVEIRFGLPLTIAIAISSAIWLSSVKWGMKQLLVQLTLILVWIPISVYISSWLRDFPYGLL